MISELILASGSPRRKELLERIGIEPRICISNVDENTNISDPKLLVEELSGRKCLDIARKTENGIILGADTIVSIDNTILGKPKDEDDAYRMLKMLSGNIHQVYTGVTLIKTAGGIIEKRLTFAEKTDVYLMEMDDEEIYSYIASGEPMDKAGAYGIQGSFSKYIRRINGDYFNVVGLPLSAVYAKLKEL